MLLQSTLKSNKFGLWLAIITAIIEGSHSAYVFTFMSAFENPYRLIHSIVMASVITGAIIFYTLRNKLRIAKFFAWYEGFMNLFYYVAFIVIEDKSWWLLVMAIPTAIMLPITLYYYAEEIKEEVKVVIDNSLELLVNSVHTEIITYSQTLLELKKELEKIQVEIDAKEKILGKELELKIIKRDKKLLNYNVILKPKSLPTTIEN